MSPCECDAIILSPEKEHTRLGSLSYTIEASGSSMTRVMADSNAAKLEASYKLIFATLEERAT